MSEPRTAKDWFRHLKAQLAGEAEPVLEPVDDDDDGWLEKPTRRDWQ